MARAAALLTTGVEAVWSRLPLQYDFDSKAVPGQRRTLTMKAFHTQRLVLVRVQDMDGNDVFDTEALTNFVQDELPRYNLFDASAGPSSQNEVRPWQFFLHLGQNLFPVRVLNGDSGQMSFELTQLPAGVRPIDFLWYY